MASTFKKVTRCEKKMHRKCRHHGWFSFRRHNMAYIFKVLLVQHVSIEQESCTVEVQCQNWPQDNLFRTHQSFGSGCSGFIGSIAKYWIDVQGFCLFSMLHCLFDSNVKRFVSINCFSLQSSLGLFIFIVLYILTCIQQNASVGCLPQFLRDAFVNVSTSSSLLSDCAKCCYLKQGKISTDRPADFLLLKAPTTHLSHLNSSGALPELIRQPCSKTYI